MSAEKAASGFLLVASPGLLDPNFRHAVVLMVGHDDEGSLGFVLNRPTGRRLGELAPDIAPEAAEVPVLQGGPVQTQIVQFLGSGGGGREVIDGVVAGASLEELLAFDAAAERVRAYAGYSGWGAEQLRAETEEGAWIVAPAHARHVFAVPAERLWSTVLRDLGGEYAWMALDHAPPSDN